MSDEVRLVSAATGVGSTRAGSFVCSGMSEGALEWRTDLDISVKFFPFF